MTHVLETKKAIYVVLMSECIYNEVSRRCCNVVKIMEFLS